MDDILEHLRAIAEAVRRLTGQLAGLRAELSQTSAAATGFRETMVLLLPEIADGLTGARALQELLIDRGIITAGDLEARHRELKGRSEIDRLNRMLDDEGGA
jgi:hypothetical protein